MKKKFLALFVTLALILAPAAFAASAVVPCYRGADAVVVSPLEGEEVTPGEGDQTPTEPDDGTGEPNPDGGTGEPNPDGGTGEPNPDGGTGEPNPDDGTGEPNPDENGDQTPEEPEVPAAPLDASVKTNIVGFVVLGLVAVCALFALVLCICGKRKIATVTKKKKA